MKTYYCWRCKKDVPMFETNEWLEFEPLVKQQAQNTSKLKRMQQDEEYRPGCLSATDRYQELTGIRIESVWELENHRLEIRGSECPECGHLLSTSMARFCANCGALKNSE